MRYGVNRDDRSVNGNFLGTVNFVLDEIYLNAFTSHFYIILTWICDELRNLRLMKYFCWYVDEILSSI